MAAKSKPKSEALLVQPRGQVLMVERDSDQKPAVKSLIIIPDVAKEKRNQGIVIAIGPGYISEQTGVFIPTTLKVGDRVVFDKWVGVEKTIDGKEVLFMNEEDVLAVIEN